MNEIEENINRKTSILLSRNSPVALIIGVSSFLGSWLADKLLDKRIQVIGVDSLENNKKQNLRKATESKSFHMVIESLDKIELELPRLDYIFIFPSGESDFTRILELSRRLSCRALLVSSIELYEKDEKSEELRMLKKLESEVAKYSETHKLNARVLRLGPVYGPRMDFKARDPLIKLIQQSITGDLQKQVALDFSSRALYVTDAIDLIIKTIFAGNTSQKIFDGVLNTPVKISEVKQILLDPVWYENRGFIPQELPPWPTPNLDKTIKILNWFPKAKLVEGLRETLSYFKDNEIQVPEFEEENWKEKKDKELKLFKEQGDEVIKKIKETKKKKASGFLFPWSKVYLFLVIALVTYAIIWPGFIFGWSIFTYKVKLNESFKNLQKGEFEKGLINIQLAEKGAKEAKEIFDSLEPVNKMGWFKKELELGNNLFNLSLLSTDAAKNAVLGVRSLLQSLTAITGEKKESPAGYIDSAKTGLGLALENFAKASVLLKDTEFKKQLPWFLLSRIEDSERKINYYTNLLNQAQAMSIILPKMIALEGSKTYLILLQNNMELRPGGGFIGSFARISFEGGKLKKIDVNDIYAIDGQLDLQIEPPLEIKKDLGQNRWFLRDSNWEPDFPSSARQAEWFYTKETGERVDGVIALDVSAIEKLLGIIGPLDLPDYNEKITEDNLFEKAISHAELSFFPGSQSKKSFITALTNQLFNKLFFLPQNNWLGIISALGKSLDEKHISIYLNDTKLFAYLASQNWLHDLPRQSIQNQNQDFLSMVEANLGANKVNYYIDRNYNLDTIIGKDGEIQHRLHINYTNRSPGDVFPGGKYKNRMRIYLPFGSKLIRALWGEQDITKDVTGFTDYGRSGYSMLLELLSKEQKALILDYSVPIKLEFKNGLADYRLDVIKQAGMPKNPFILKITYPLVYQLISDQSNKIGPQEQTIQTDLSKDRSFEVRFKK